MAQYSKIELNMLEKYYFSYTYLLLLILYVWISNSYMNIGSMVETEDSNFPIMMSVTDDDTPFLKDWFKNVSLEIGVRHGRVLRSFMMLGARQITIVVVSQTLFSSLCFMNI
jgi:hypothetical protein